MPAVLNLYNLCTLKEVLAMKSYKNIVLMVSFAISYGVTSYATEAPNPAPAAGSVYRQMTRADNEFLVRAIEQCVQNHELSPEQEREGLVILEHAILDYGTSLNPDLARLLGNWPERFAKFKERVEHLKPFMRETVEDYKQKIKGASHELTRLTDEEKDETIAFYQGLASSPEATPEQRDMVLNMLRRYKDRVQHEPLRPTCNPRDTYTFLGDDRAYTYLGLKPMTCELDAMDDARMANHFFQESIRLSTNKHCIATTDPIFSFEFIKACYGDAMTPCQRAIQDFEQLKQTRNPDIATRISKIIFPDFGEEPTVCYSQDEIALILGLQPCFFIKMQKMGKRVSPDLIELPSSDVTSKMLFDNFNLNKHNFRFWLLPGRTDTTDNSPYINLYSLLLEYAWRAIAGTEIYLWAIVAQMVSSSNMKPTEFHSLYGIHSEGMTPLHADLMLLQRIINSVLQHE
jgi:hypothetical protein